MKKVHIVNHGVNIPELKYFILKKKGLSTYHLKTTTKNKQKNYQITQSDTHHALNDSQSISNR